ncbi:MAG: hypothetical protein PW735_10440 [Acidobacteriaceae bacterium]|nr:hypothetical protein [Acidobacteriaceae bacterium]
MATASIPTPETEAVPVTQPPVPEGAVLVCLPTISAELLPAVVQHLRSAFADLPLLLAGVPASGEYASVEYLSARPQLGWVLASRDYAAAAALSAQYEPSAVLLLGTDALTLSEESLRALVETVRGGVDLALPRYKVGPSDALVSRALMYPLTRVLFAVDIHFPLPADAALSPRLLARLSFVAGRSAGPQGTESLLWPVAEAAIAGLAIREVEMPARVLPAPTESDLNAVLASVAGSLFADVEAKATFWQRARNITQTPIASATADQSVSESSADLQEISAMMDAFRLASNNLGEIWALVLPPQSLLAVKKLARMSPEEFTLDAGLWARIVYDFALAFHARTLNRGHLLGAMTPLYLAWVASQIRAAGENEERAARLAEATAQGFEREKPYFVSRWRWPDRFNP